MKKGLSILFILGFLLSLNLVLAAFSLPSPPPAPGVDSSTNNTSNSVPNSYPPTQGNVLVNNQNTSSDGSAQSTGLYWASFIGIIVLVILITLVIIYFVRKHKHVDSI